MIYHIILIGVLLLLIINNLKLRNRVNYYKTEAEKMYQRAIRDGMTGVYNYEYLVSKLRKNNTPYSLLMLDIDNFKEINDQYGHQVGDMVIKDIANKAESVIRKTDLVARYGGDEFIIALFNCSAKEAKVVGEKLHNKISQASLSIFDEEINFAVSIGCYTLDENSIKTEDALRRVDTALYQAKEKGKDCIVNY
ncbi:diguanylate cyclase (GGDEF)-like protein [Orenia metallireducens]|uniref:Diguanylate cyclase (GGDEF) domain-containing protein n=1 Tax=Orenia metallireducens TaxID=1413210 RepID=A0A285I1X4_9FIRM|nr:GGDEF domain-containing protein [Orenia metallireducens]PRX23234.1 diguanylate cyclase (GGDEF)-like protein [Orenia metallireducens]SNY41959.1 diguanylate cyclase (GGDEF) domain-containing protein [Orenia metallireducens]